MTKEMKSSRFNVPSQYFKNRRTGRAFVAINQGQLTEEVALCRLAQCDLMTIRVGHAQCARGLLDQIHHVASVLRLKEPTGGVVVIERDDEVAKLIERLGAQSARKRDLAQLLHPRQTVGKGVALGGVSGNATSGSRATRESKIFRLKTQEKPTGGARSRDWLPLEPVVAS